MKAERKESQASARRKIPFKGGGVIGLRKQKNTGFIKRGGALRSSSKGKKTSRKPIEGLLLRASGKVKRFESLSFKFLCLPRGFSLRKRGKVVLTGIKGVNSVMSYHLLCERCEMITGHVGGDKICAILSPWGMGLSASKEETTIWVYRTKEISANQGVTGQIRKGDSR